MRTPTATYRLQFTPEFGFQSAREILPYLAELGISDIYASPIFQAKKGSMHGYDVVDPTRLNPELGSDSDFEELNTERSHYEMGWLQDIVPNHMAFHYENRILMDVLESGPCSAFYGYFDVDWEHPHEGITGKLLAPFLGKFYGESLEDGEITLKFSADGFTVHYYDHIFPLKIDSYGSFLTHQLEAFRRELGSDHPDSIKLLGILYVLKTLPSKQDLHGRRDQVKSLKKALWELYKKNPEIKGFLDANLSAFNGEKGNPDSFTLLDELLSDQIFRLSFWKFATEEINYRRFFNINDLICLSPENEEVFSYTHSLIFKMIEEGAFTGIRVDHIDGLYDPTNYFGRIRERTGEIYLIVEKILDMDEELPPFWSVQGTTGYDFANHVNGIFCSTRHKREFNRIYTGFTGIKTPYEELVADKKRLIIGKHMAGDIDNLAQLLKRISSKDRFARDITLYGLKRALVEVMAHFPVYRTYTSRTYSSEQDKSSIRDAVDKAGRSNPGLANELQFIERFLLLQVWDYLPEEEKDHWLHFVMRFQQFTAPLMAKGFEDTTLYVYSRLISLNEVGGDPNRFGISVEEFHRFNKKQAELWPASLNATSTHDTKRGEDVRARINVLSEMPKEWERNLKRWSRLTAKAKKRVGVVRVPDRNDEYFLFQTLIGTFPFDEREYDSFVKRIKDYVIKAVREAKVHTAWLKPDTAYEEAYISFVETILRRGEDNLFMKEFLPFQQSIAHYGILNSLSQLLIKASAPGVPDFYQGSELWDLNLVDPDNRKSVDFEKRKELLREIIERTGSDILTLLRDLLHNSSDGRVKLFLTYKTLKARKEHRDLFQKGSYLPLKASGVWKGHMFAFARKFEEKYAVTLAPRLLTTLVDEAGYPLGTETWQETCVVLPGGGPHTWKNVVTDQILEGDDKLLVGDALIHFPAALLIGESKI